MALVGRAPGFLRLVIGLGVLLVAAAALQAQSATPSNAAQNAPTFTKDVLPILQRSCQQCHHPGTSAPMSLMSYREARP
jgi:cytochrome c5